jgi:hypothetical protein
MIFRMTKVLRFWVDCEYPGIKKHCPGRSRTELLAQIQRLEVFQREDAFAAVIRCTADPAKADWSRPPKSPWSNILRSAGAAEPRPGASRFGFKRQLTAGAIVSATAGSRLGQIMLKQHNGPTSSEGMQPWI